MTEVIVTDGLWRKSVSAIRSLGKSGYTVNVLGDSIFTTGFWSKFTHRRYILPSAKDDPNAFGSRLIHLVKRYFDDKPIILPMEDDTLIWLAENQSIVKDYLRFLIPSYPSLLVAEDKSSTLRLADQLGLPIPITFYFDNSIDCQACINALIVNGQIGNYIIKPVKGTGSSGIVYLEMGKKFDVYSHWLNFGTLMVQERISSGGEGIGVSLLYDKNSKCLASFCHRRLQQYPNSGGPSTSRTQAYEHQELLNYSKSLLSSLDWSGVAMVEWKVDPRTNQAVLMEINPRFWGSLELAVRSGVDFPTLYAKAIEEEQYFGKEIIADKTVVCRWMLPGDILRYITQDKNKRESLKEFLSGLPHEAEEWDSLDIKGTLACIACPCLLVLNPKYWKYLLRN